MATDRFIYWESKGLHPTYDEIELAVKNYVNLPDSVTKEGNFLFIALPGNASFNDRFTPPDNVRWFEVFYDKDYVDVMTRLQDEFTSAVADGFARAIARRWSGKLQL